MPKEILLPELAESVVEGEILKWLVNEGDFVKKDQSLVEVMTDKVTVELPSPYEGVLLHKHVKEGDVVPVHARIATLSEPGEVVAGVSDRKVETPIPPKPDRSQVEDEGAKLSLFKPDGKSEVVKNPFPTKPPATSGREVGGEGISRGLNPHGRVIAVPAARKLARDLGLDIAQVPGSGPNGRVRIEDVKGFVEGQGSRVEGQKTDAVPQTLDSRLLTLGGVSPIQYKTPKGYENLETRVPLRGLRRAIANQMVASHLYTVRTLTVDEVDMSELVRIRSRLKEDAEKQGVKLSYLPFIFKALAIALKKYPAVNSSMDEAKQEIVLKNYCNLGMAVAAENGLVVPVIKDIPHKSILQIAKEINELAEKARSNKLSPEEMAGSTFSVTNIGSIGALFSFPIINVPDAAILGVHSIQKRPVVDDQDQIVIRHMMYLSLSFDHRLVDGAEAAMFCKEVIRLLERPERLFLETL